MEGIASRSHLDQTTLNIINYLEKRNGICQINHDVRPPAERSVVLMWEQKNSLLLPEDLKNFFLTNNGFHLTWSVKIESLTIPVGNMSICSIGQMVPVHINSIEGTPSQPSLWDLEWDDDTTGKRVPSFTKNKIFQLDSCEGYGKACLVYTTSEHDFKTEYWFLDRSLKWHYLCHSFQAYYRLMLMHLGLPHWHLAFTDVGLPPTAKQWFNLYAPVRLEVDTECETNHTADETVTSSPLDLNKIFKGKNERKKPAVPPGNMGNKRKPAVSSARSATSLGKTMGPVANQR
ncbi:tubulin polyglutamylase complex subunit 2-like [Physella acuta]|uniref:tubulin polyglutamylase complex subunit 2-like n=1 Tax=Physella acuta TaxID=109671 RepID=UPI0027DD6564|nr:tubulin polyglutamylase complex subunit 2-like [Physella acuta]